jgi:broad specificity phosphatase PhoE
MSYPDLYIARHGQTEWNLQRRMQGALDAPLTELGKTQAHQLNAIFKTLPPAKSYLTSPQLRAVHTAAIALAGIAPEITTDTRLREIGVGDWQGMETDQLKASVTEPLTHMLHYYDHAPNGETFAGLRLRCSEFLDTLTGPTVLITHGITSRMLRLIALDQGTDQLSDLPGGQGIVFHVKDGVQKILS